ncbi:MAG: hypothetical protein Q8P13_01190 [bacterium]|nr:hypothetical protein [bacterium]
MSDKNFLEVSLVWSPSLKQQGYSGQALAVSSENSLGKFDILPQHANFVTQINKQLTIHTLDKKETKYEFNRGVLEVSENIVRIFLGI